VRIKHLPVWIILLGFALEGCRPAQLVVPSGESSAPAASETQPIDIAPEFTVTPSPTATITATLTITPSSTLFPTPDAYAGLVISDLTSRDYGGGELVFVQVMEEYNLFTRYLIAYPSDGLTIYGFMNLPRGEGPFPVIIATHGFVDPQIYNTVDYTTRYADALAEAGYLVLHPNLRGYWPSEDGPNLFRVGMAIDVLNLVAHVKNQAGNPGPLERADPDRIGLWGHSMGGGISTRVMVVSPDIDAVLLYGAMSGDDLKNYERIFEVFSDGQRGQEELSAPPEAFERISPVYFLERVQAAVSIHHGENDEEVPLEWSVELCDRLQRLEKSVECFTYPGQPHTFFGDSDQQFIQRSIEFFDRILGEGVGE
jgi:dipeptidyl aminopeptidase/acylaminoacyl peptidase